MPEYRNAGRHEEAAPKKRDGMKRRAWMALSLLAGLTTACTQETNDLLAERHDDYLELHFSMAGTRTDLNADGAGSFREGDRIGLCIDNGTEVSYREVTLTNGAWEPQLRRSDFGSGELVLSAHYPTFPDDGSGSDTRSFTLSDDQRNEGYTAADLIYARRELPAGSSRAELVFTHAMHRLRIELSGSDESLDISLRSRMRGRFDLLTGEATAEDVFGWITPRRNADGSFEAVIFPQEADIYRDAEGLLKVTDETREATFKAPESSGGEALTEFRAGRQLTIRLTVKPGGDPDIQDLAGKQMWVYGLNVPDFPGEDNLPSYGLYAKVPAGIWFRKDRVYEEIQNLTWEEGCGWYDCNKSPQYSENDGNLCWAASASDLLLWWMNNNRGYVEAYQEEYGSTVSATVGNYTYTYTRPSMDFLPLLPNGGSGDDNPNQPQNRNEVFQFFKNHSQNVGAWNSQGVRWFITGESTGIPTNYAGGYFPGFFAEVFSEADVIATESNRSPSEEEFNRFIVDALSNRQALGFTAYDIAGLNTGNHALVIWGVEFDAAGKIAYIYYCDNNNADQDVNGAVITRRRIVYETDPSSPTGKKLTYIQPLPPRNGSSVDKKRSLITNLCSVDLRQDIWARKYAAVHPQE